MYVYCLCRKCSCDNTLKNYLVEKRKKERKQLFVLKTLLEINCMLYQIQLSRQTTTFQRRENRRDVTTQLSQR